MAFYVRLTLDFLDGTSTTTIADIWEAVKLDTLLKNGSLPKDKDSIVDLSYTTLRELPDDTQEA